MSKRNPKSKEQVEKWLRRGDGQGEGASYRPFFLVRDVPSRGRSGIEKGLKSGRDHHLLSDIEYGYFLLAEYSLLVAAIREQLALLPWEETQALARTLGISHPRYRPSQIPRVMTSDLVLTMVSPAQFPYIVISCKPASELEPSHPEWSRTMESLYLERAFWSNRPVKWVLGTDKALPRNKIKNLDFTRNSMKSQERDCLNPLLPAFCGELQDFWSAEHTLNQLMARAADRLRIPISDAFTLFGRAVWLHLISIDLDDAPFHHERPISLKSGISQSQDFGGSQC